MKIRSQNNCIALGLAAAGLIAFNAPAIAANKFGSDMQLLKSYTDVVVLKDGTGNEQVAVVPKYQGRVMTSTLNGADGLSFGWVNPKLISSGKYVPHMNQFGGEDRLWLGPEGGQYGLFFKQGSTFDLPHWQVPAPVDSQSWRIAGRSSRSVSFHKIINVSNFTGTKFTVGVNRTVRLLTDDQVASHIGESLPSGVKCVGFESINTIINNQPTAFAKDKGLLSIWILGQFNASPSTVVVMPYKKGSEDERGIIVNGTYFGKVPDDRLKVDEDNSLVAFKADGKHRSKIGMNAKRTTGNDGSYDADNHVLTIVQFSSTKQSSDFVNSMWEIQKKPYGGDEINSYNDGGAFGPFYEIESSSPAIPLGPGESITHMHRTIHLQGSPDLLDPIAVNLFGVHLDQINSELPS